MSMRLLSAGLLLATLTACPADPSTAAATAPGSAAKLPALAEGEVRVLVEAKGYTPARIEAKAGQPLTLVFRRDKDDNCGQEVVFPDHDIKKALPLGEDVRVSLTPKADETIKFTCGMAMYKGAVVATK